jgi:hypothetical protein
VPDATPVTGLAVAPALVSLGGRDAAGLALAELDGCALLTAAECRLQVERLNRKITGKTASRVNIAEVKGL